MARLAVRTQRAVPCRDNWSMESFGAALWFTAGLLEFDIAEGVELRRGKRLMRGSGERMACKYGAVCPGHSIEVNH